MNVTKFLQSKKFTVVLIAIAALIALLGAFKAGMVVGYKKAGYSYRWGENYHRNFAGPRGGFFGNFRRDFADKDFINGHGTFGSIIKIDSSADATRAPDAHTGQSTLVIKGKDDVEKIVLVSDNINILNRRESLPASDLQIDDKVVVIGSPNEQGQIEARIIRVFR